MHKGLGTEIPRPQGHNDGVYGVYPPPPKKKTVQVNFYGVELEMMSERLLNKIIEVLYLPKNFYTPKQISGSRGIGEKEEEEERQQQQQQRSWPLGTRFRFQNTGVAYTVFTDHHVLELMMFSRVIAQR